MYSVIMQSQPIELAKRTTDHKAKVVSILFAAPHQEFLRWCDANNLVNVYRVAWLLVVVGKSITSDASEPSIVS